jgi:hypothetical protein
MIVGVAQLFYGLKEVSQIVRSQARYQQVFIFIRTVPQEIFAETLDRLALLLKELEFCSLLFRRSVESIKLHEEVLAQVLAFNLPNLAFHSIDFNLQLIQHLAYVSHLDNDWVQLARVFLG